MSIRKLTYDVGVVLGALRAPYTITNVIKNITTQFIINDFGVVISVMNPNDYAVVDSRIDSVLKGYRKIFIAENENLHEKRYEIIWELMRSGYIRWIRYNFSSQFLHILETDNLGNRIIDERLRIWGDQPKYKYLINTNLEVKEIGFRRVLTQDSSFFDYMPENYIKIE